MFTKKNVTLKDLPTWKEMGPKALADHPPKTFSPLFPFNDEINEKVTFWMKGNSAILECDAIVNAANAHLARGGGICGVIHKSAGPELAKACKEIGYTATGKAAITPGFNLPAKYVIHAVGPIGEHPKELQSAYQSTLDYIDGDKVKSIGFCCISTGIYGYPIVPATKIALQTVREFLENEENRKKTDRIIFVVFEPRDVQVYYQLAHNYFPIAESYPGIPKEEEKEKEKKEEKPKEEKTEEQPKEEKKEEEKPKEEK